MVTDSRLARARRGVILILALIGAVLAYIALSPERLGLNFTSGFGVVQMAQLLVAITLLTVAGLWQIRGLRGPQAEKSLQADIAVRLTLTGLIFSYATGLADLLQIGTHVRRCPALEAAGETCGPYVGPIQLVGLIIALITIVIGLLLYYTSRGSRQNSLFGFLIRSEQPGGAGKPE